MKKFLCFCLLVILLVVPLTGCKAEESKLNIYTYQLDPVFSITPLVRTIGCDGLTKETITKLNQRLKELDDMFNPYNEKSMLSKLNKEKTLEVSDEFIYLLKTGFKTGSDTKVNGVRKYQLSMFPVFSLWKFKDNYYNFLSDNKIDKIPSGTEIKKTISYVDDDKIKIEGNKVTLGENQMIDLGSIAKGYGADEVRKILEEKKVKSAIIDIGGNIVLLGKNIASKEKGFKVKIKTPETPKEAFLELDEKTNYLGYIYAKDTSVVTSGTYERFVKLLEIVGGGFRITDFHHILDYETGYPMFYDPLKKAYKKERLISVSIITPNSAKADSLSTSVFCMGLEKGLEFVNKLNDVEAIFVTGDKKVYVSNGLKNEFVFNINLQQRGYKYVKD